MSAPHAGSWLEPLTGHWIDAALAHLSHHAALVRVTVTALRGSAPREAGASILIDATGTVGSIGGGRLEWHATALGRELLRDSGAAPVRVADLNLGPELGQCCGGRVQLWVERLTRDDLDWLSEAARRMREERDFAIATEIADGIVTHRLLGSFTGPSAVELRRGAGARVTLLEVPRPRRPNLWIFGAGHVGQALVSLLAELAMYEITWIDSRAELLPAGLPDGVTTQVCAAPPALVAAAPAGTRFLVMTHDHMLDYELCREVLARDDAGWLGLIGSSSKSARFRSRLRRAGLDGATVAGLTCPIGISGISSKLPAAIAIAIAAQLLQQGSQKLLARNVRPATHAERPAAHGVGVAARAELDAGSCTGGCSSCAGGAHGDGRS